jgi:cellulose synthase/poly-beta-1,6-N-acetylglucosamine synthase-like glycosyltransferase
LKNKPLTVITPVYNGAKFLAETIDSVLNNSDSGSIEYIVVNDGSTDATSEILSRYSDRLTVINQENKGESESVNVGILAATSDFCLIVNADDPLPSSDIFHNFEAFFIDNPSVVVWYPDWQIIDAENKIQRQIKVLEYSKIELLGNFNCLPGPGAIFRRDAAIRAGMRNPEYTFVSDYDFWLRMSLQGTFARREGYLAQWRTHDLSTTVNHRGFEMSLEMINVIKNFLTQNPHPEKLSRQAIASSYISAAHLRQFSDEIPARRYLLQALIKQRGSIRLFKLRPSIYIILMPLSPLLSKAKKYFQKRILK